jgi:hypothetical protein
LHDAERQQLRVAVIIPPRAAPSQLRGAGLDDPEEVWIMSDRRRRASTNSGQARAIDGSVGGERRSASSTSAAPST